MTLVDFFCVGSMVLLAPHIPRRTALVLSNILNAMAIVTIVVTCSGGVS